MNPYKALSGLLLAILGAAAIQGFDKVKQVRCQRCTGTGAVTIGQATYRCSICLGRGSYFAIPTTS